MNTVVSIPDDVFEKVEERATALGMSRDEFYTAALTKLIVAKSDEEITENLNRLYAGQPSELDPVIIQMQA
ncbi:MAG: hypothetical protein M3458_13500, partial [Acidobacteriota bacterium]|nr:hypothetical protein [Acidobacteriota bacterium]